MVFDDDQIDAIEEFEAEYEVVRNEVRVVCYD